LGRSEGTGATVGGVEELGASAGVPLLAAGEGGGSGREWGLLRVLNEEQYIAPIGIGLGCVFLTWAFLCLFGFFGSFG